MGSLGPALRVSLAPGGPGGATLRRKPPGLTGRYPRRAVRCARTVSQPCPPRTASRAEASQTRLASTSVSWAVVAARSNMARSVEPRPEAVKQGVGQGTALRSVPASARPCTRRALTRHFATCDCWRGLARISGVHLARSPGISRLAARPQAKSCGFAAEQRSRGSAAGRGLDTPRGRPRARPAPPRRGGSDGSRPGLRARAARSASFGVITRGRRGPNRRPVGTGSRRRPGRHTPLGRSLHAAAAALPHRRARRSPTGGMRSGRGSLPVGAGVADLGQDPVHTGRPPSEEVVTSCVRAKPSSDRRIRASRPRTRRPMRVQSSA